MGDLLIKLKYIIAPITGNLPQVSLNKSNRLTFVKLIDVLEENLVDVLYVFCAPLKMLFLPFSNMITALSSKNTGQRTQKISLMCRTSVDCILSDRIWTKEKNKLEKIVADREDCHIFLLKHLYIFHFLCYEIVSHMCLDFFLNHKFMIHRCHI